MTASESSACCGSSCLRGLSSTPETSPPAPDSRIGLDRKDSHDTKLKQTLFIQRELAPRLFSPQLSGKLELSLSWAAGKMCIAEVQWL